MSKWEFDADRIRLGRESRDLSQAELGVLAGVTAQQISAWETGSAVPGQGSFLKIVNALEMHPRFFYVQCATNGKVVCTTGDEKTPGGNRGQN